ncbi:SDR family NAD(P)-dependent oxidoreductase [Shimazuella sp. KC615]|uniref:SDR family NAD(P)-dependent oxidoreductase n=1 Tax=Shimazuella alba TaxID=2690964 RepID=A0A6I4VR25_9BACL|nr:SDR family NAD(P)-dependent oxidoreductase [Shimazuella alba]
MWRDIVSKTAIVTGASRGVGYEIVKQFVQAGYQVVATARNKEYLHQLTRNAPDQILPVACDITKRDQVEDVVNQAISKWGQLDILVNNAGVGHFAPVEDLTEEQWDEMLEVNSKGPFLTCKYAIPHLKETKGHIVNISSGAGLNAFANGGGYCASKFALMALSDALTQELKPHHVRVSTICPGSIKTNFGTPKDWALSPEKVAETVQMVISSPKEVIYGQIVMRPQVP